MPEFIPEKLHVEYTDDLNPKDDALPRCYTLAPADPSADMTLTISRRIDEEKITRGYNESLADKVFGIWKNNGDLAVHIHVHVNEGIVLGRSRRRVSVFQQHLPVLIRAIGYGDRTFILAEESHRQAPLLVHFYAKHEAFNEVEDWGTFEDYLISD